jgi:hypothetical protein
MRKMREAVGRLVVWWAEEVARGGGGGPWIR